MASYHRILHLFGRSIDDNSLQCDCDIHPWEIQINGERWPGKIRLIGFIDVFFLISYIGTSSFTKGIIVYKDENTMKEILNRAHTTPKAIGLPEVNVKKTNVAKKEGAEPWALSHTLTGSTLFDLKDESIEPKKGEKEPHYFHYKKERDNYIVRSVGHPIDLKTTYPASSVTKYEIKIRKHQDPFLKRHTKLALKQHDTLELIVDAMKLGFIASAEIEGHALGHVLGGGLSENALRKFLEGVLAGQRNSEVGLAGDKM